MKCCKFLADDASEPLPFGRTIVTGYYDGPTDGVTECSLCRQAYSFRKVDWDDLQDVRILGFAPLQVELDEIAARLGVDFQRNLMVVRIPPLDEEKERYLSGLLSQPPIHVGAVQGWPGGSQVWRDVKGLDLDSVKDWFSFLGIIRRSTE